MPKFRKKIQERVEKNAVKVPNLTYKDSKGREHTEDIVLKRSNLPLVGDWGRIYPPVDENGKTLWMNLIFGGKKNFIKILIVMAILFLLYSMMVNLLGASREYLDGTKYVIIEKPLFEKYCTADLPSNIPSGEGRTFPIIINESTMGMQDEG